MSPHTVDLAVVLPTVDRPALLGRALRSCFEGAYRPQEAIVVHDSPDHVAGYDELYEELASLPIRRIVHDSQKGPSAARNTGWQAATASWIYFLDDDDHLLGDGLETIAGVLASRSAEASVIAFGSRVHRGEQTRDELPGDVIRKYGIPFWAELGTLLIRRTALQEVGGFDPSIELGENRDLMVRMAARFAVEHVDEAIVCLDYAHVNPRQSEREGTVAANIHLLRKNEAIYRRDPLWWRSAHLYPACHAARRGHFRTAMRLYREWARSSGRLLDVAFLGALASSALSAPRDTQRR